MFYHNLTCGEYKLLTAGHTAVRDRGNPHNDEDYSNLDLQDRDVESNYHLINEDILEGHNTGQRPLM